MATIDLGKIKQVWRGTYASGTAYTPDDVVQYTDSGLVSSYICIANTTGNAPSSSGTAHGSWNYLAKGGVAGTNGTDLTSTLSARGDIVFKGASALTRLPKGTAGYVLKQGANDPEWGEAAGGGVVQIKQGLYSGHDTYSSTTYVPITNFNVAITPTAADSSFLIMANINAGHSNNDSASGFNIFDSQVGTSNGNEIFGNGVSSGSRSRTFQTGKFGLNSISNVSNYINWQTNISAMYTPSSNNANARTFTVCQFNPHTTTYMNYATNDHSASMSTVSNIVVMEIANGIYS